MTAEANLKARTVTIVDLVCLLFRLPEPSRGTDVVVHALLGADPMPPFTTEDEITGLTWLSSAIPAYTALPSAVRSLARKAGVALEAWPDKGGWKSRAADLGKGGEAPTAVVGRTEAMALLAALAAHLRTRAADRAA